MQADNLLNKAEADDSQELIAKLAYQAGIPKPAMVNFQRKVIKDISKTSETADNANMDNRIIKSVVQLIMKEQNDMAYIQEDASLKFEEDLETHKAIQKLPLPERLAVILFHFHGIPFEEIGLFQDIPVKQVESNIESAVKKISMDLFGKPESVVQKRLELLAKSYNRIQLPVELAEEDNVVEKNTEDRPTPADDMKNNEKAPVSKKSLAILAGTSLFLTAVIGASFLFNDQPADTQQTAAEEENPTTVSKQMVKNWEAEYEEIRKSATERLGLSPETFNQLEYVQKADELRERTFSRQNIKHLQDDPQRMEEQVEILMLNIETPKGMLDSVDDYSLLSSEVSEFLLLYKEKTEQLMVVADKLLKEYEEELSDVEINGPLSPEELMQSRKDIPAEIEELTASLREYTFQYTVHPNENRFRTIRDINRFYEIHPFNSDMVSMQYLDILWSTPIFDETGMLWPVEHLPQFIMMMARFLSDPMVDPILKSEVEPQLTYAFYTLLKGDDDSKIFDREGRVKEEFQLAWESLLQHDNNPVTFIMLPILEEFKESGWKESAHYKQLAKSDILYAIDLERNGELADKLPNGDLEIETVTLNIADYDYSDVQSLYKEFSSAHDLKVLVGVEPMEILKLYHYANKIEDIETMWHLTANDELKPSLEEYVRNWRKRPEITETMRTIEIYKENLHRQGRKVYLRAFGQQIEMGNDHWMTQNMMLVTERDQIWLMQHQLDEYYTKEENFEIYDANVQSNYKSIAESKDLNSIQSATPAEIAGIFLMALENEDLKTMRLMVHEMDESISDEEFEDRWLAGHLIVYSKMTGIFFTADAHNLSSNGIQGNVDIIGKSETMEESRYLAMEKVGESWMIGDMFGY